MFFFRGLRRRIVVVFVTSRRSLVLARLPDNLYVCWSRIHFGSLFYDLFVVIQLSCPTSACRTTRVPTPHNVALEPTSPFPRFNTVLNYYCLLDFHHNCWNTATITCLDDAQVRVAIRVVELRADWFTEDSDSDCVYYPRHELSVGWTFSHFLSIPSSSGTRSRTLAAKPSLSHDVHTKSTLNTGSVSLPWYWTTSDTSQYKQVVQVLGPPDKPTNLSTQTAELWIRTTPWA